MLKNNSKIWLFYLQEKFVCSMMFIPATKESLKKMMINLNFKEVADYGPMFVNSKYVGRGLQLKMLKYLDEYSLNIVYKYAFATIHPDNIYSINNILKDNFELINTQKLTRGIRNIYVKKLYHPLK